MSTKGIAYITAIIYHISILCFLLEQKKRYLWRQQMNIVAKWIWKTGESSANTWMDFVKTVTLSDKPQKAIAKIAVDSKYWLYINGNMVIFEGGLKRGPSQNSTYYDEVELTSHLQPGENKIAILVWYFGKDGFSHKSSGMGGLLFEADIDGKKICSDETWKLIKNPAYIEQDKNVLPPNFRLSESNIYFDATKDLGKWYAPDYNVTSWDNADVICQAGEGAWGSLEKRTIPQFKNYGIKKYVNSKEAEGFTSNEATVLEMKLPYNAQLTPYLEISAPAGKNIVMKTENYDTCAPKEKCLMSVYITKEGRQEYEALGWINGESVFYELPAGITVHSLKYRETGYDTERTGEFICDDGFLNSLWEKSYRTLYITMRDTFMDCPDRERVQWWGDVNVEMQMMMYCLDEKSLQLYKKGADSLVGWAKNCGYMLTVVPSGTNQYELPFQNLAGIYGFYYYYEYTGDIQLINTVYPMSKNYVLGYSMTKNGLAEHKSGSWDWADWGDNADIAPMENAWYYMALQSCVNMAKLLGMHTDIALYEKRMHNIEENYDRCFAKDGYYYDSTKNGKPDDRTNALAVLSGLADKSKYEKILEVLQQTENSSPYMEKYVLDALCEMGYIDAALERMKKRYREMVDYPYSTLWEYWNTNGTRNHAWSGGPLITMSKYIAGIRPISAGYEMFEIKPHIGNLNYLKCIVPSIKGNISLIMNKNAQGISIQVTIPENTVANVYVPINELAQKIASDYEYLLIDDYAKIILPSGEYSF